MQTDKTTKVPAQGTEEKTETKTIREFCLDGNCEVKMYKNRRYMRRKKKVA